MPKPTSVVLRAVRAVFDRRLQHAPARADVKPANQALARQHPEFATIIDAAYLGALLNQRAREAHDLMKVSSRTDAQEVALARGIRNIKTVLSRLTDHRDSLEEAPDQSQRDELLTKHLSLWTTVLPEIKKRAVAQGGYKRNQRAAVAAVLTEARRGLDQLAGAAAIIATRKAAVQKAAIGTIVKYCTGALTRREAAFELVLLKYPGAGSELILLARARRAATKKRTRRRGVRG